MLQYILESTVVQGETGRAADIVFIPDEALRLYQTTALPTDPVDDLGLARGVPIESAEELQDVFFASLSGRVVPFDEGSFGRWRPQRQARAGTPEAVFAEQLATTDVVPVTSSPIHGTSLAHLLTQGTAWTVSVADAVVQDPLRGLAVLAVAEGGIAVTQIAGAAITTVAIWVKWRMRQRLGLPPDWVPPEDRRFGR